MLTSLDPRIARLGLPDSQPTIEPKEALDQFETFEVFHQKKDGTAYAYVGPVHAPSADVAFLFAKEQYSRRFPCTGMWVTPTRAISLTRYVGDTESVYDTLTESLPTHAGAAPDESMQQAEAYARGEEDYAIFHLKKRGKAHVHVGMVRAASPAEALLQAKAAFGEQRPVVNVWVVRWADVLTSDEEDRDIWSTTPEKKYRDAIAYKVQDRIDRFKQEQAASPAN
ncbi:phenylacetic acid degradation b [Hymenobacter busanensis]|uniref:Phenylacetic acid degradation b n=1 Tax=Hymenobacter busanensis TaxID=2607656 RepID=A0A7L4ZWS9_9BACT|nr:phenylacetic acid degradation b [Hymenobacter busanensis]KAA9327213.1 phenylacetic acid degradation b [Hymenobacter busanensis]QHJ05880.1 phenylacetic acid degradation b [Hymenobacter busanensis]